MDQTAKTSEQQLGLREYYSWYNRCCYLFCS